MLKNLVLAKKIKDQRGELDALQGKDADFKAREESLLADIDAAQTKEEREAVESAVSAFDAEFETHEKAKAALSDSITALENELSALEQKPLPVPANAGAENNRERMNTMLPANLDIRALPMSCRAFDALPLDQRKSIVAQEDVQNFLAQLRDFSKARASVTGAELTIPVIFLDIINQNRFRYSKLLRRVRVRTVRGEARQTIGGTIPEAVWTECCGALNELNFVFNQVVMECYKLGGFILICNSLLRDSDLDLVGELIEMISEALGKAKDKAILYGKGGAYKMPLGIVTRLAQESQPAGYPANAPAWVDLHSTNIITINGPSLDGAAFWAALRVAAGKTFTLYNRGEMSWCMNSKTYAYLESKAIATTMTGEWVAIIGGRLPIVSGDIDVLEFMPDYDIVGGYFDLYLWAQREGVELGTDMNGFTLRVKDNTLLWGKERGDGQPIIPGAFVAMNIYNQSVTTTMTFAGDTANDADLEALTVGALSLSPSFDAGVVTYTASATNATASAAVTATPAQNGAAIGITVTAPNGSVKNVVNGQAAALAVGANVIAVTVKNGNAVKVYTVTVTRASS